MASVEEIQRMVVRIVGDGSHYVRTMDMMTNRTKAFGVALAGQLAVMSGQLRRFGKLATISLTLPLVAAGTMAVKAFGDFDQAMTASTSIMDVTAEQVKQMRDLALDLGGSTTHGPTALAESYFFLASAGKNAEQSMALLPSVAEFATAGNFDLALATDLLTDAQSALGLSSKNAAKDQMNLVRVSDVLVKANTLANATVQQFSESLTNTAGASLRAFNKDVEEGVAVLAAYADQGVKGNVAGTNLSRVMLLLSKSSRDNAKAHKDLGFSVFDAHGKMRNFSAIVKNLETITGGMSDETKAATLEMLGFEARVQQAILPLLGTSDAIRRYEVQLRAAAGTTKEISERQLKSFNNQVKILWNRIKILAIGIGQDLVPAVKQLISFVEGLIDKWDQLAPSTKKLVVQFGIFVAVIGPASYLIGVMLGLVSKLVLGFTYLKGAVATYAVAQQGTNAAMLTGNAVMGIMRTAFAGLAAVIIYKFAKAVYNASQDIHDFNAAIEKSNELAEQWSSRYNKSTEDIIKQSRKLQGIARTDFLAEQLATANKELKGYENQVKLARKAVEQAEANASMFGSFVTDEELNNLRQAKDRLRDAQNRVEAINSEIQVLGETEGGKKMLTLQDLEKKLLGGNEPASIKKKMNDTFKNFNPLLDQRKSKAELANQIFEQYRTPLQKFRAKVSQLESVKNLLPSDVFRRAMEDAFKEFQDATNSNPLNLKANIEVKDVNALSAGTSEALGEIIKYGQLRANGSKAPPAAKKPPAPAGGPTTRNGRLTSASSRKGFESKKEKQEEYLKRLVDLAEEDSRRQNDTKTIAFN